jgi:hypothetical protein
MLAARLRSSHERAATGSASTSIAIRTSRRIDHAT